MIETKSGMRGPDPYLGLDALERMTPEEIAALIASAKQTGEAIQDCLAAIDELRRWPMSYLSDEEIGMD